MRDDWVVVPLHVCLTIKEILYDAGVEEPSSF